MAKKSFEDSEEFKRLKAEMLAPISTTYEKEAPKVQEKNDENMLVVHKSINKAYQRITENVQMRIPTDVLEFVESRIYDKADRITVLYHLLELGAEVIKEKLLHGDVIITYGRKTDDK